MLARSDVQRFTAVVVVSLIAGLMIGRPFLGLCVGLLVTMLGYYRGLLGFLNYLRHGAEDNLPDMPGVVNELIREIEALDSDFHHRETTLSAFVQRFQDMAAALPDALLLLDGGGRVEWANTRAQDYLGIRWPQDGGLVLATLVRDPGLAAVLNDTVRARTHAPIEIMAPVNDALLLEIRFRIYGSGIMLLVARDISEPHRLNQMRRDFIANASHELRTPLTVISGYLEAFEDDAELCPKPWRSKIAQMRAQAGRMQRLIEDLLKLSSLENPGGPRQEDTVAVPELLAAILREAAELSGAAAHRIESEIEPDLYLRGDARDLYSAFSNIVVNAVQYTPAGGAIRVHWYRDLNGAHLEVADTGEGIAAEHLPRLTERFYRVDKGRSRAKGGTGLGLAIVKHVLAQHDARLEIRSTPGAGSIFLCHFPETRIGIRAAQADRRPQSA
jgi:two-component system phosphate regulon sensor histidine kinase PhoR